MHMRESGEMYLETILILSQKNPIVRAVDIGEYMGFSKPSVSRAVGLLKNGGYIKADTEGHLSLTDTGTEIANRIYERHKLLTDFFIRIGVDKQTAADDACRVEHDISNETFEAICKHVNKSKG